MKPKEKFRESLIGHLERYGVTVAQLARATGVSKAQLDKLAQRKVVSTNAHDAMAIANYFGKTVEEFVGDGGRDTPKDRARYLISEISDSELETVIAQLEGILAKKGKRGR